ncbi:unnamed protein product [Kuraishia capsulata CBS 1993]|uniref:D-isomer specific 2-hydroxyacid dehydrogenase NAD-binding domain-containing protein n=1 Tax=Kuraishia capsulata CBS 1993 TaxID=1382522 RepID=W6MQ26_9ASCO|nr:uncharacterized protein KUCA_T00003320001 [Kuraishia capsulata CBS 1993]CDK27342.1 unnamed protein product [Kuraishia capsulata CBS 1993]
MSKPRVLFVGDTDEGLPEFESFATKFECVKYTLTTKEQLIADLDSKFGDIVGVYGGWLGFGPIRGLWKDVIPHFPASLKIITLCSAGHDGYDMEALREKGITLCNSPTFGAEQVADTALFLTLHSFRLYNFYETALKGHGHTFESRKGIEESLLNPVTGRLEPNPEAKAKSEHKIMPNYAFGQLLGSHLSILTPQGRNAVIVGLGSIGSRIAKRLNVIGMNIHYVKRTPLTKDQQAALGFEATFHQSLEEAAPLADVVIFAIPGTPETAKMFCKKVIDLMPSKSRVINVGRGSIVDDGDLLEGMRSGKIIFAGLDVFYNEPLTNPEIAARDDVVLIPHIASSTVEVYDATARFCLKNLENVLAHGEKPQNAVN